MGATATDYTKNRVIPSVFFAGLITIACNTVSISRAASGTRGLPPAMRGYTRHRREQFHDVRWFCDVHLESFVQSSNSVLRSRVCS
jgi:hypothetical protein